MGSGQRGEPPPQLETTPRPPPLLFCSPLSVFTPHQPSPRHPRGTSRAAKEGEAPGLPHHLQDLGALLTGGGVAEQEVEQCQAACRGFSLRDGQGQVWPRAAGQLGPPLPAPGRASFPPVLSPRGCVTSPPGHTSPCVCKNSGPWVRPSVLATRSPCPSLVEKAGRTGRSPARLLHHSLGQEVSLSATPCP